MTAMAALHAAAQADNELIADLRAQLERVTNERDRLREALGSTIDDVPPELREDDRRASAHFMTRWREAARRSVQLSVTLAQVERTLDAAAMQAAKSIDGMRAEMEYHQRRAAFYKSCAISGERPTPEQIKRADAR